MADNVTLPGTGLDVKTREKSAKHVQAVELDFGGSGTVDVMQKGQNTAAQSIPVVTPSDDLVIVSTTITRPADTTAYTAGDTFANSTSAPTAGGFTLANVVRASGGSGIILNAAISMSGPNAASPINGELWIFDQAVTAINDNAAFAISDAEAQNMVAIIPFTANRGGGNNALAFLPNIMAGFACVGSANLRFLVKVVTAYTPVSGEVMSVRLAILRT
jgi:hypothetical protein